ncbi:2-C-methyl-D-erythritol 2,4-cyclodiphosphate synthase [bacterium]|jgi:2-C-methyl-D-erythritol 2,4-cyclodiphosphate synthase|nr:2-C-methyl-D-erythritol 2,4-cyclodiphosphate synthase [bacterium]
MRIGHGYDAHRLVDERPLVLGGVTIPYKKGLEGHSDADAVIHALCDAILGAMCLGDIGSHFPDTDPSLKNIDSRIILQQVYNLMKKNKFVLGNADITILAQAPKMADHIPSMKKNLSIDLDAKITDINVKATTTEKMGFVGRGEGIAVYAVVLIASS